MSFRIKAVTAKNFLSIGNTTQSVNLNRTDLTLILGENIDLGGDDAGARNGTGKSALLNIVSYGLYGHALTNIKKDNLINRTNAKHMVVTVDFELNGQSYRVERGRRPNIMKFWVGDVEQEVTNDSQGDSRETQAEIERLLGLSHDMFRHIVALNTYTEPFLNLRAADQRTIIEQLLGITVLSEKAEKLKEQNKATKDAITQEEYRIKAVLDANKRIEEQIESLRRRQAMWKTKHDEDLAKLEVALKELLQIDIDSEVQAHKDLAAYNAKKKEIADLKTTMDRADRDKTRENLLLDKLKKDIFVLEKHTCNTCGQPFHDDKHKTVLEEKKNNVKTVAKNFNSYARAHTAAEFALKKLGELGTSPVVFYKKEEDAIHHRTSLANLQEQVYTKYSEVDPYAEQIIEMEQKGIEPVTYDVINALAVTRDHQEFLLKLLTNKDSFIRKRIIDQNLSYLNARLGQYLDRIGLPHTVKFNNDLTVTITELGRELDFDNLSRGERNRLILSLSWAFRDVWESLYQPINLLFIDELIDSGLDGSGMEAALAILKKMSREHQKSIWLVSHRDELAGRVENVLRVVKENGFTSYNNDIDIV